MAIRVVWAYFWLVGCCRANFAWLAAWVALPESTESAPACGRSAVTAAWAAAVRITADSWTRARETAAQPPRSKAPVRDRSRDVVAASASAILLSIPGTSLFRAACFDRLA